MKVCFFSLIAFNLLSSCAGQPCACARPYFISQHAPPKECEDALRPPLSSLNEGEA